MGDAGGGFLKRATSLRHLGKTPHRFRIKFNFIKVEQIKGPPFIYGQIERNLLAMETKVTTVDQKSRSAVFEPKPLITDVTLYIKKGEKTFEPKEFKVTIKRSSDTLSFNDTIGRGDLNISDFAHRKESTKKKFVLTLYPGGKVTVLLECENLGKGAGEKTEWDKKSEVVNNSDEQNYKVDIGDMDDFKDLDVNVPDTFDEENETKEKNKKLSKKNREMTDENKWLWQENKKKDKTVEGLQAQVENLKNRLRTLEKSGHREPAPADLIRDLKNSKIALAIVSQENEELREEMYRCGCPL